MQNFRSNISEGSHIWSNNLYYYGNLPLKTLLIGSMWHRLCLTQISKHLLKDANSLISLFGMAISSYRNSPDRAINSNVKPGNCWAFHGSSGHLVIKLAKSIYVSEITIEHIPKQRWQFIFISTNNKDLNNGAHIYPFRTIRNIPALYSKRSVFLVIRPGYSGECERGILTN